MSNIALIAHNNFDYGSSMISILELTFLLCVKGYLKITS